MPDSGLFSLYKLYRVEAAIVHVAKLQAGIVQKVRAVEAEWRTVKTEFDEVEGQSRKLRAELADLELRQKTMEDKAKKHSAELYSGRVVGVREVKNLEAEIANLKEQRDALDDRILELLDLVPPAEEAAKAVKARLKAKEVALEEAKQQAREELAKLEKEKRAREALRPAAEGQADKALLARYRQIGKHVGGLGMSVVNERNACSACGMEVPIKVLDALDQDRVVTCESCRRILFKVVPES